MGRRNRPRLDAIEPAATYTAGAAARHLGLAPSTIGRAIASGRLAATRVPADPARPLTREPDSWAIQGADIIAYFSAPRSKPPWEPRDKTRGP